MYRTIKDRNVILDINREFLRAPSDLPVRPLSPPVDVARFWAAVDRAQANVNSWPAWKRGLCEDGEP